MANVKITAIFKVTSCRVAELRIFPKNAALIFRLHVTSTLTIEAAGFSETFASLLSSNRHAVTFYDSTLYKSQKREKSMEETKQVT
jgi:hypothetical protein